MSVIFKILMSFFSTIGFSMLQRLPLRLAPFAGTAGAAGFSAFLFVNHYSPNVVSSALIGATVVGIFGELFASITKKPSTLYTIPGIIPLVPGYSLYYSMLYIVQNNLPLAASKGSEAIFTAIAIACGIAISTTIMRRLRPALDKLFGRKKKR